MAKKPPPFNNPFGALKLEAPKKAAAAPAPRRPEPKPLADDEAALFLESVGEVAPARGKSRAPPPAAPSAEARGGAEEAESLARLAELVVDDAHFDLAESTEFVEGSVQGFDERVLRRLRKGEFPVGATLDLHGLTRDQARPALEKFLTDARVAGRRCVLVVTGRGLHSPDAIPVLKEGVQRWLTHGRPARQVLAFCSARPQDGGTGAVYVLLRR